MKKLLAPLAILVLVGSLSLTGFSTGRGKHDFTGKCELCHLVAPQKGQPGIFVQDIDYLCKTCHQIVEGSSHPSEVAPSMKLPKVYTLDWQGRITCATCHNPHDEDAEGNPYMLKTALRGKAFCQSCHKDLFRDPKKHLSATRIAHTKSWTPPTKETLDQALDQVSLDCLECHEGSVGPAANYTIADQHNLTFQGMNFSHPIGMDYAKAAASNRELRPIDDLSPMISLYEGKVGCASCHNPFSHEKVMLVFDNKRSALCYECHLK
ncbi:putative CXXCH cytochrome family protein [Geothermobacter ehrlichii]|uniref:Putative CXXCH cytochrome family protein n=1 Tax=Geothermobacter ehrlichii TaxID=213224 RepID=A0A5D3WJR9_9BACT|nr:cytochrome c3 family protein [Geothermobacter ehrlichii]TYO98807.1 putative CXXCH cytochrome family protein [Geothermobacter ehrlichii]